MSIIQIEVTNACLHRCSNCTRFCGHHRKPFFMNYETFQTAVDSLVDFKGMIGIMGGEPTLHPQFACFTKYAAEKIKPDCKITPLTEPIHDFAVYRHQHLRAHSHKIGLWTSLGDKYYENFELIQDLYGYQCVNDHWNPGLHQALMITRKELGIPDKEWIKFRDKCWVQNLWSASITPKGAFFCEIAAALDMLFDGPGGWPIEPGWWRRTPEEFGEQLNWCELCSAALKAPSCQANLEKDIISPEILKKLEAINSPKIKNGAFTIFDPAHYDQSKYSNIDNGLSYLPNGDMSQRVAKTNKHLFPHKVTFLPKSSAMAGIAPFPDWCAIVPDPHNIPVKLEEEIKRTILNPGCAYYFIRGFKAATPASPKDIADMSEIFLFNRRASALINMEKLKFGTEMIARWNVGKLVRLNHYPKFAAPTHNTPKGCSGECKAPVRNKDESQPTAIQFDVAATAKEAAIVARLIRARFQYLRHLYPRIALYGAGAHTNWLLKLLDNYGLFPDRISKIGVILDDGADGKLEIKDIKVLAPSPAALKDIDAIVLSTDCHQTAMRTRLDKIPDLPRIPIIDLYEGLKGPFHKPLQKDVSATKHDGELVAVKHPDTDRILASLFSGINLHEGKQQAISRTFKDLHTIKRELKNDRILDVGVDSHLITSKYFLLKGAKKVVAINLHTNNITKNRPSNCDVIAGDVTKYDFNETFNFIFGRAILEHICDMAGFAKAVERLLEPGGIAYFDGSPMWDSPQGSHCDLKAKSGTAYYFYRNNPLKDYDHLMYTQKELYAVLEKRLGSADDAREIAHFVFHSPALNRMTSDDIIRCFLQTSLRVTATRDMRRVVPEELRPCLSGSKHSFDRLVLYLQKK